MPIIKLTMWPVEQDKKTQLMQNMTKLFHEETGVPLDKISMYIEEVQPNNWSDAGVVGTDPEFKEKSRRLKY
jgi:4-oxalocrotonate tautomerase